MCPVENTACNERKIFVSLLSIAQDDNLMSKKVQVKYIHHMPPAYIKTLISEEFCILSKSVLEWDETDFWQIFEDVKDS